MTSFDITELVIIITILYFVGIILYVSKKLKKVISTTDDFFDFGEFISQKDALVKFEKTLTATNASFTTAFLGLFYMGLLNVYYALFFSLGYLLSFLIFPKLFLKKVYAHSLKKEYYPQLIGIRTESKFARKLTALIVIASLILFLFTEIYGYSVNFLSAEVSFTSLNAFIIGIIILILLGWYVIIGGYNSVVITDYIQFWMIIIGSLALILIIIFSHPLTNINFSQFGTVLYSDLSQINLLLLIPSLIIGLIFSQLIYFDTWQRLTLFSNAIIKFNIHEDDVIRVIGKKYYSSAFHLSYLYFIPILLSIIARSFNLTSFSALIFELKNQNILLGALVIISTLTFVSALLSTADTYLLAILQVIHNDFKKYSLSTYRRLVFIIVVTIAPFILFQINLGTWLAFIFYLGSGFVGPIILIVSGYKLNKIVFHMTLFISILLIIFVYFFNFPIHSTHIDIANALVVLFSILFNLLFGRKKNE